MRFVDSVGLRAGVVLLCAAALGSSMAGDSFAVSSSWKTTGTPDWFTASNWTNGVPQFATDTATFSSATSGTFPTQLNSPASLGTLLYSGNGTFQLSGNGPLKFDNLTRGGNTPFLTVSAGAGGLIHAIVSTPIILPAGSNLTVSEAGQAQLQLQGAISGDGAITYAGSPTGTISSIEGDNSYTGATTVNLTGAFTAIDAFLPTAFGSPTVGTTITSGSVYLGEGTAEPFLVRRGGFLSPTPTTTPQSGKITLAGGNITPGRRYFDAQGQTVTVNSDIEIQAFGTLGFVADVTNPSVFTGAITGSGLLVFEGQSFDNTMTLAGPISVRGDVTSGVSGNTVIQGAFRPAGDLLVDGGINSSDLRLAGDMSQFHGDIETRLGRLTVATGAHVNDLKLDSRLATWRQSLQNGSVTVESGATLTADRVEFYAGALAGKISGVDVLTKKTRIAGSVSGLTGFDGEIHVEDGFLDVLDSQGLGTAAGATRITSPTRAAINLTAGTRVDDAIYLNNSSGFEYTGGLIGDGEAAGPVYLGDVGSYVSGYGADDGSGKSRSSNLTISGPIHGGALIKPGAFSSLTITSSANTYSGATEILGGSLILTNGGRLESTSDVRVNGALNSSGLPTARLLFDDRGAVHSQDRLADGIPVTLDNGQVELQGAGNSRETIGKITAARGYDRITATAGTIHVNQFERQFGAVVSFLPTAGGGQIEMDGATPVNGLLGGWALYNQIADAPSGFATVANGVVQQASAVQQSLNVSTETQNVQVATPNSLTQDVTVNSIKTVDNNATIDLQGHKLTVSSGGLLVSGTTNIKGGTLTSGTPELFIHNYFTNSISANITDNGSQSVGLHVDGSSAFDASGTNTYTGGTIISRGGGLNILNRSAVPAGDTVELNFGRYMVNFNDTQPLALHKLIVRAGGFISGTGSTPVDADAYEVYAGTINQPISGDGVFTKRGEDGAEIEAASPNFVGKIVIEQGTLTLQDNGVGGVAPNVDSAIEVDAGGTLSARSLTNKRLVILNGGAYGPSLPTTVENFPVQVHGSGTFRVSGQLSNTITGDGLLTFDGPFDSDRSLTLSADLSGFSGDMVLTGGVVNVTADNSTFAGTTYIRAASASSSSLNAFGNGGAVIDPEGFLTVAGALQSPVKLAGGTLRTGALSTLLNGAVTVTDSSVIDTVEVASGSSFVNWNVQTNGVFNMLDGASLKKTGPGSLTLNGPMSVGLSNTITAWTGTVVIKGAITAASLGSSLNLVGNNNFTLSGSVNVPAGTSLRLLQDGVDSPLKLVSGSRLAGNGQIVGEVDMQSGSVVAPGASPGTLSVGTNLTIEAGGIYEWEVANVDGLPGQANGWDLMHVGQALTFKGTSIVPWILRLKPFLGSASDINGLGLKQWLIASAGSFVGFDPLFVKIDSSQLINSASQFAQGHFSVFANGPNLYLVYAVPEPSGVWCVVLAGLTAIFVRGGRGFCRRCEER